MTNFVTFMASPTYLECSRIKERLSQKVLYCTNLLWPDLAEEVAIWEQKRNLDQREHSNRNIRFQLKFLCF